MQFKEKSKLALSSKIRRLTTAQELKHPYITILTLVYSNMSKVHPPVRFSSVYEEFRVNHPTHLNVLMLEGISRTVMV